MLATIGVPILCDLKLVKSNELLYRVSLRYRPSAAGAAPVATFNMYLGVA